MTAPSNDTAGVVVRPPLLYLAALLIALTLHWVRPMPIFGNSFAIVIGLTMMSLGVAIAIWGARTMSAAGTNIDPTLPSTAIVTSGPFRLSRNPLYLALTLLYLGVTVASDTWWGLIGLIPLLVVMHLGVVLREEHYLEGKFGDEYRKYKAEVARYLPLG